MKLEKISEFVEDYLMVGPSNGKYIGVIKAGGDIENRIRALLKMVGNSEGELYVGYFLIEKQRKSSMSEFRVCCDGVNMTLVPINII